MHSVYPRFSVCPRKLVPATSPACVHLLSVCLLSVYLLLSLCAFFSVCMSPTQCVPIFLVCVPLSYPSQGVSTSVCAPICVQPTITGTQCGTLQHTHGTTLTPSPPKRHGHSVSLTMHAASTPHGTPKRHLQQDPCCGTVTYLHEPTPARKCVHIPVLPCPSLT